jgi:hypothetical protein
MAGIGFLYCTVLILYCTHTVLYSYSTVLTLYCTHTLLYLLCGTGFLVLSACYILIDVKHVWSGAPFRYVGMNSIGIYM